KGKRTDLQTRLAQSTIFHSVTSHDTLSRNSTSVLDFSTGQLHFFVVQIGRKLDMSNDPVWDKKCAENSF
ncbi:hypothetical protein, partial [Deinococcus marmoris]|uniref:hypothetical protein n=1 Tax=Deinococcus marmoris TaxID=249408 RepID=UPI00054FAE5B